MVIYVVHPGNIKSKCDGDVHFISAHQLVNLYQIRSARWYVAGSQMPLLPQGWHYVHLYPRSNGDYSLPKPL